MRQKEPTSTSQENNFLPGRKLVLEFLKRSPKKVKRVFLMNSLEPKLRSELPTGVQVELVEQTALNTLCPGVNHQGVVAEISPQQACPLEELYSADCIVALDQVLDPQNLGSIFRAAASFGVGGLLLCKHNSAPVTPTVRKVSVGATELVPFSAASNLVSALEKLKKQGFWVYGSSLDESAENLLEQKFGEKTVLVLGSEEKGLRPLVQKTCDVIVQIPQYSIDSLNVSQAATVLCYEYLRQRDGKN